MQYPKPLHQTNNHLEGQSAFPPAALCIPGVYTADVESRIHQFFPDMAVADFEEWRRSQGPTYWDNLSPQYGVPGGPDAIISLHCDGEMVELPVHACFLQTLFTKAEPIGFQGRTAIFNGGSPFTMQLFVLLYEYMYHGDVEPMYRILTGLEGPNHEQIISATEGKWVCASQIINRRPMSVLESMGRKTLALWSMALVGGVYDRSVYTVLNIVWWLLGGAFIEQHADPNIQGWMDDIYAEWRRKAAEISSESFPTMEDLFGALNGI